MEIKKLEIEFIEPVNPSELSIEEIAEFYYEIIKSVEEGV